MNKFSVLELMFLHNLNFKIKTNGPEHSENLKLNKTMDLVGFRGKIVAQNDLLTEEKNLTLTYTNIIFDKASYSEKEKEII
jgi:hypothetical protein